ncbi:hypothetical protein HOD29_04935 [archaeon]|jgi:hypothetical protein|nr:hypothetical protein [archaeon]
MENLTKISPEEFNKLIGDKKHVGIAFLKYSVIGIEMILKGRANSCEYPSVCFYANKSFLDEVKDSSDNNCAEGSPLKKFKQGRTYKLKLGDPIIVKAKLLGYIIRSGMNCLIFQTENKNLILSTIEDNYKKVFFTQILRKYGR